MNEKEEDIMNKKTFKKKPTQEIQVRQTTAVTTPADMISLAVSKGADLTQVRELMSLQREWEANEARKAYHVAMAGFKANPLKIEKDKKVGYDTSKGHVGYAHASLANVVEQVTLELSKHGLSASWKTQQNGMIIVTCKITHVQGHTEETSLSAPADASGSKNSIQAIGSTITYLERYTLLSALGLATYDQDNDGKTSEVELINDKQLSILRDSLASIDEKEAPICKYLGIESLESLPKSSYQKALNAITARGEAKK